MSVWSSCEHALHVARRQAFRAPSCNLGRRSLSSAAYTRPAPLFLDFLAPRWQTAEARIQCRPALATSKKDRSFARPAKNFSAAPSRHATAITNPRTDEDGNEMSIIITPRAEHRLKAIAEKDGNPGLALRVSVESGGCHGFQYLMKLISTPDIDVADDTIFVNTDTEGDFKARIVMDEPSLELLKGSSIDYTMELIGSQFKVTGIPGATSSCGCGTSFDVA